MIGDTVRAQRLGVRVERLGVLVEPRAGDPQEAWGVLNPASARGRDGRLYLFPRLVARGNYSRVGRAAVVFDAAGNPVAVERLGVALEPELPWERNGRTGGVEDPRITFVPSLDRYVMTYTAYGPLGPRIALAVSHDLTDWCRLGPVWFDYEPALGTDLNLYPNKDAVLFPEPVPGPDGALAYPLLHRPMWDLSALREGEGAPLPAGLSDPRPGIWVSYAPVDSVAADLGALRRLVHHRLVALPERPWEALKIGGGTPPVRTEHGWLTVHHGVAGQLVEGQDHQARVRYSAGVMVHDPADVSRLLYRSRDPLLEPELDGERDGVVPNVVFPTALDLAAGGEAHVYYGMADTRIGVARLRWSEEPAAGRLLPRARRPQATLAGGRGARHTTAATTSTPLGRDHGQRRHDRRRVPRPQVV